MYTQCKSCNFWLSPALASKGCPNCGLSGRYPNAAQVRQTLKAAEAELSTMQNEANDGCGCLCPLSWPLLTALAVIAVAIKAGSIHLSNGHLTVDDLGLHAKILGQAELATLGLWWIRQLWVWSDCDPGITAKESEVKGLRRELEELEQSEAGARGGTRVWPRPCLLQDIHKIQARLQKIQADRHRLHQQREMLLKEDPEKWKSALELIAAAETELIERADRERIALREIALAQWVNKLEAYSVGIEALSVEECDLRLTRLKRVATQGGTLLTDWDRDDAAMPLCTEPETSLGRDALAKGFRCRQQVEQGLTICQELLDGVQARRVVATVHAVGNHATAPTNEYIPRARKALEELTARSEIGQLRESFRQLEDLAAHSSARREVDRLTAHLGQS